MRHFSFSELDNYRSLKRRGQTNALIASRWRRTPGEVDVALNAMLGRDVCEAADVLNRRVSA